MEKEYSIAEIYKLIQDNPNDNIYKQLLEQKKKRVISQNKKKNKCLYKNNTEIILECQCEACEKEIQKYGYNRKKICNVLKYLINKANEASGKQNKLVIVGNMFNDVLLSSGGLRLIENNDNFKDIVQCKLIEFYNEEDIFNAYIWYRRIFNERIPVINKG